VKVKKKAVRITGESAIAVMVLLINSPQLLRRPLN